MSRALTKEYDRDNIVVGAGRVYFSERTAGGDYLGEIYLGDAVSAGYTVATERTQVYSGSGPVAARLLDYVRQQTHSFALVLHSVTDEGLRLFSGGAISAAADVASAVTDEEHTVYHGREYQLGASATRPGGVGAVTAGGVTVSSTDPAISAYTAGTAYKLDPRTGRILILGDGTADPSTAAAIGDGQVIQVDYTPVAYAAGSHVLVQDVGQITGAFRYVEDQSAGEGRDFYARLCNVSGSGELALMSRDTEQRITLAVEAQEPGGDWPIVAITRRAKGRQG